MFVKVCVAPAPNPPLQKYEVPPVAVIFVEPPLHTVMSFPANAFGKGFTVTSTSSVSKQLFAFPTVTV